MKKYELTDDSITFMGRKLFRIRAIRSFNDVAVGDLGGYIEKEENLSHDGDAWIYNDAWISGNARIYDYARISGNARIYGNTFIYDNARIYGNARISDYACIYNDAWISGNACISGFACISNYARISGNAWISGFARICGYARICGDAWIHSGTDYLCFQGLGSQNRNTTFFKCEDGHIHVSCGCFSGNLAEFETKVKKTHGDSKYAKEYLACIEVVKIHFKEENK